MCMLVHCKIHARYTQQDHLAQGHCTCFHIHKLTLFEGHCIGTLLERCRFHCLSILLDQKRELLSMNKVHNCHQNMDPNKNIDPVKYRFLFQSTHYCLFHSTPHQNIQSIHSSLQSILESMNSCLVTNTLLAKNKQTHYLRERPNRQNPDTECCHNQCRTSTCLLHYSFLLRYRQCCHCTKHLSNEKCHMLCLSTTMCTSTNLVMSMCHERSRQQNYQKEYQSNRASHMSCRSNLNCMSNGCETHKHREKCIRRIRFSALQNKSKTHIAILSIAPDIGTYLERHNFLYWNKFAMCCSNFQSTVPIHIEGPKTLGHTNNCQCQHKSHFHYTRC
mmetsp:Transcript_5684/g.21439  ORF Transcript_5684/g.21439 Transcript_5684/m.21439 type:complete len:332 (-) Transcript_5684:2505-3500(-)